MRLLLFSTILPFALFTFTATTAPAAERNATAPASGEVPWPGANLASEMNKKAGTLEVIDLQFSHVKSAPGLTGDQPAGLRKYAEVSKGLTLVPLKKETAEVLKAKTVNLPDQWQLPREHNAGWYLMKANLQPDPAKQLLIHFERVVAYCEVYVNGEKCGEHLGAYTPFDFDISKAVKPGENTIAIYVHDQSGAVDQKMAYAQMALVRPEQGIFRGGIYSSIQFIEQPAVHLADVFVKTSTRNNTMTIEIEATNDSAAVAEVNIDLALANWPDGSAVEPQIDPVSISIEPSSTAKKSIEVKWGDPRLWSPEHPNLYVLHATLTNGQSIDTLSTRFGFREFWIEGKNFILNGTPVRLIGESVFEHRDNPDAYKVEFSRGYFETFKKLLGVNACRSHMTIPPHEVFLGADEAGMMMINQSAIWSSMAGPYNRGGERFLQQAEKEFEAWVRRDRNCPSVVIWDTENEMVRIAREHIGWTARLRDFVRKFDDTRPTEQSGAGWFRPDQEIIHVHMHEHYTRIADWWAKNEDKPIIFGEYWIGGRGEKRLPSSREYSSIVEYAEEEARLYALTNLELRYWGASGVMPFTIHNTVFHAAEGGQAWDYKPGSAPRYSLMSSKIVPILRHSLQPMTVFFWPRTEAVVEGGKTNHDLVVCNDSQSTQTFEVRWNLEGEQTQAETIELEPAAQWRKNIELPVGAQDRIEATLLKDNEIISSDTITLRRHKASDLIAEQPKRKIFVYGNENAALDAALAELKIDAQVVDDVPTSADSILIIPPQASTPELNRKAKAIRDYLQQGGRILCLAQGEWPKWSPVKLSFWSAMRDVPDEFAEMGYQANEKNVYFSRFAPIYAPDHPAFAGIDSEELRWWNAYDGRVSDDALVRPAAVNEFAQGAWRVLAGASRRENASLVEARIGKGLLVLSQAQVIEQWQNPEARRLFVNLLRYLDGEAWPAREGKIRLAGSINAESLATQIGATVDAFGNVPAGPGALMIAGDGASGEEITDWAAQGGTVLILSADAAAKVPGIAVKQTKTYSSTQAAAHAFFWGVSSINFFNAKDPIVGGELVEYPADATVLLSGLKPAPKTPWPAAEIFGPANPVAISMKSGKGEIVATTLAPWKFSTPQAKELLSLILANAGVPIAPPDRDATAARALKTVRLNIDGRLDDWTNDIEDRNVNPHRHAIPMLMPAENAVAGTPENDMDFSAIAYFLWDDQNLYAAGSIFGKADDAQVSIVLDDKTIKIARAGAKAEAILDGADGVALTAAGQTTDSRKDFIDARLLSFTTIDKRIGHLKEIFNVPVRTFEVKIPFSALGLSTPPEQLPVSIQISRGDGSVLAVPADMQREKRLNLSLQK